MISHLAGCGYLKDDDEAALDFVDCHGLRVVRQHGSPDLQRCIKLMRSKAILQPEGTLGAGKPAGLAATQRLWHLRAARSGRRRCFVWFWRRCRSGARGLYPASCGFGARALHGCAIKLGRGLGSQRYLAASAQPQRCQQQGGRESWRAQACTKRGSGKHQNVSFAACRGQAVRRLYTLSRAWFRSASRSSICSIPMDRRTMPSLTPALTSSAASSWR